MAVLFSLQGKKRLIRLKKDDDLTHLIYEQEIMMCRFCHDVAEPNNGRFTQKGFDKKTTLARF